MELHIVFTLAGFIFSVKLKPLNTNIFEDRHNLVESYKILPSNQTSVHLISEFLPMNQEAAEEYNLNLP